MIDNETLQDTVQETQQPESIETQEVEQGNVDTQQAQNRSSKDDNMRALREKAEKLQKQNDEYARVLEEIERRHTAQAKAQPQQPEEPEFEPSDEDLLEGKHYKKLQKKYKQLEEKQIEIEKRAYESVVESKIRAQFPDYEKVVTLESVKALRDAEPELAASLHLNPNYLEKAVGTYKAIERLGLKPSADYDHDKEIVQKNAAKPRTVTSISPQQGESPLTRANAFANGFTDDVRKAMWKEMEEARKRY